MVVGWGYLGPSASSRMAIRLGSTFGLLGALLLFVPGAAATLPPEADPVCAVHYQVRIACNVVSMFVYPEAPLCVWPVYNRVPCSVFANPVLQNDAGSGRDAGDSLASAIPVSTGFHRANIVPVVDQVDVFTFTASAGDDLRFRYDGAVTMELRDPTGNLLSSGTFTFTGTAPSTGTYSVWGSATVEPYHYYFCLVIAGVGPSYC